MRPEGVEIAKQLIGTNIRVEDGGGGFVLGDDVDEDEPIVPVFDRPHFRDLRGRLDQGAKSGESVGLCAARKAPPRARLLDQKPTRLGR